MKRFLVLLLLLAALPAPAQRLRGVTWGKWMPVTLFLGPNQDKKVEIQVRALLHNGAIKEFTTGDPHDVTEQLFVVQRAYRVNDYLPEDGKKRVPQWKWQRGGWLLVDRTNGRITQLKLPEFDAYYSIAAWYRDYVAYCGITEDSERVSAVVAQVGNKKPIARQPLGAASGRDEPESECTAPKWQRTPVRVTFHPVGKEPVTIAVKGQAGEPLPEHDTAQEPPPNE